MFLRTAILESTSACLVRNRNNTPVISKFPFWQYTSENKNAFYVCINMGEAYCPQKITKNADSDAVTVVCVVQSDYADDVSTKSVISLPTGNSHFLLI